jgi:hypothetical protein
MTRPSGWVQDVHRGLQRRTRDDARVLTVHARSRRRAAHEATLFELGLTPAVLIDFGQLMRGVRRNRSTAPDCIRLKNNSNLLSSSSP